MHKASSDGSNETMSGVNVHSHRDLQVWQRAMDLVTAIYRVTKAFPREEIYGLTAQLCRAMVSVPANIAEGNARGSRRDYAYFLAIARGSLAEAETLLLIAIRLDYLAQANADALLKEMGEIGRMLNKLRSSIAAGGSHPA